MTFGPTFDKEIDSERILTQMEEIRTIMSDGIARTLAEIEAISGFPQASISAQLRHLRKKRFGEYNVIKQRSRSKSGTWLYKMLPPQGQVGFCFGESTSE